MTGDEKIKMPVIFIGHGSPMNAIEGNIYTKAWKLLGENTPVPRAILMISAHWITPGKTSITTSNSPGMIYDMYGFPDELYKMQYKASGSEKIAKEITKSIPGIAITYDDVRGFDHGIWSVLIHMFPDAQIPVIALSIDYQKGESWHYELGQKLAHLREEGILIIGSGNIVHNLQKLHTGIDTYPWAKDFELKVRENLITHSNENIVRFRSWGEMQKLAHPTYDHFIPFLIALGATDANDSIEIITEGFDLGSISMTSIRWG